MTKEQIQRLILESKLKMSWDEIEHTLATSGLIKTEDESIAYSEYCYAVASLKSVLGIE